MATLWLFLTLSREHPMDLFDWLLFSSALALAVFAELHAARNRRMAKRMEIERDALAEDCVVFLGRYHDAKKRLRCNGL